MHLSSTFAAAATLLLTQAPGLSAQHEHPDCTRPCGCAPTERTSRAVHCETREARLPAASGLSVDAGENGGITVRRGSGTEVAVRSHVQAWADSDAEARELARRVRIETGSGRLRALGPPDGSWSVSFVVEVPAGTDLALRAHNGPLAVEGLDGPMDLRSTNGPISLVGVGGNVRARTQNGPLTVKLSGERWTGTGLDAATVNGPVHLHVPRDYSARLEAGTVHGPFYLGFPVSSTLEGHVGRRIVAVLGSGGAPLRVSTTNGPISIER